MIAGNSWGEVKCPVCMQINIVPYEKPEKVSEWERFLEMKHTKITCPACKKNIYTRRESEYVRCNECGSVISIVKEVPNRPTTIYHHFNQSVLIDLIFIISYPFSLSP